MDDRISSGMAQREGGDLPTLDRAHGTRRQRNGSNEAVYIGDAFERSHVEALNGRPYPVEWRRQGAEEAWSRALGDTHLWRRWSAPGTSHAAIRDEMLWQLERNFTLLEHEDPVSLRNSQTHIANQISVNLLYFLHKGTVIEARPALESLLANSDVDLSLPMSMVAPPYAAQYLHFGELAMGHLKTPASSMHGQVFDGAFCFFGPRANSPGRWHLELVLILTCRAPYWTGRPRWRRSVPTRSRPVAAWLGARGCMGRRLPWIDLRRRRAGFHQWLCQPMVEYAKEAARVVDAIWFAWSSCFPQLGNGADK